MTDAKDGTLLMVGKATDAIVVAADSAGTWGSGAVESCPKIHPVGEFCAFLIRGHSAFAHKRNGEATEELDLSSTVLPFLAANPQKTLASTTIAVSDEVVRALKAFFLRTQSKYALNAHLVFVGYDGHVPSLHLAQFLGAADQTSVPSKVDHFAELPPGFVVALGGSTIADEILKGSREAFTGRARRIVQKHQSDPINTNSAQLLRLFQVCLEATERDEVLGTSVRAPNQFAVIRPRTGFAFSKPVMY